MCTPSSKRILTKIRKRICLMWKTCVCDYFLLIRAEAVWFNAQMSPIFRRSPPVFARFSSDQVPFLDLDLTTHLQPLPVTSPAPANKIHLPIDVLNRWEHVRPLRTPPSRSDVQIDFSSLSSSISPMQIDSDFSKLG